MTNEAKLREILQGMLDQAIDYDGRRRYEGIPPDSLIEVEFCAERFQKAAEALSLPTPAAMGEGGKPCAECDDLDPLCPMKPAPAPETKPWDRSEEPSDSVHCACGKGEDHDPPCYAPSPAGSREVEEALKWAESVTDSCVGPCVWPLAAEVRRLRAELAESREDASLAWAKRDQEHQWFMEEKALREKAEAALAILRENK